MRRILAFAAFVKPAIDKNCEENSFMEFTFVQFFGILRTCP